MRGVNILLALSTISGGAALERRGKLAAATDANSTLPLAKRFIIEFEPGSNHADLKNEIASRPGAKILKEFKSTVFSGLSVETTADNIDTLQAIKSVSKAWNTNKLKLGPHLPTASFSDDASAPDYSVHYATGVDKLHEASIYGEGAVVAIIDTGTQYTHPALGGGFGPGYKVAGGYDFVGQGCWPYDGCEKEPDDDPMDQIGHGTHVAGIVAGKSDTGFVGVAPEATILSYKVFTSIDGTDEDTLIESFLTAYDAGADIITSSIGGAGGFADDAWATVASRLVDEGVVVTIAAGNNGEEGPFFGSNGAAGKNVLAVASTEASILAAPPFLATFNLDGETNTTKVAYLYGYYSFPTDLIGMPIVPLSGDMTIPDEACDTLPETTGNLSDVISLVRLGGCGPWTKAYRLEEYGAQYILFYNDDEPIQPPYTFSNSITGTIEARAGAAIIETVKAGGNVTADFSLDPVANYVGMYNSAGGVPNYFTSWGGLYDLSLKPEIAAPGGDIFSTYPDNTYAVLSGTSMATPYVAGVAALYIGKYGGRKSNPNFDAKKLAMRIISSGGSVPWSDGSTTTDYGFWAPVPQVGTGMVNGLKVLNYTTSLSFAKFELNDTHHFSRYHSVDITNNGKGSVTYRFALQDAAGVEIWQSDPDAWSSPRIKYFEELTPVKMTPQVSFPSSFTLKAGETKTAKFGFNYPTGLKNLPLYSGKILISSSEGEQLGVPYYGLASDLKQDLKQQFPEGYPRSMSTRDYIPIDEKSSYTFNLSADSNDFPIVYARTHWGIDELRWDIFESTWTERKWVYPPVPGQNGYVGTVAYWAESGYYYYFDPATDDANNTISFPLKGIYRSSVDVPDQEYWWLGRLGDGTQIKPGKYVMRFAVLAPFGDPTHADNWDTFTKSIEVLPLV